MNKLIVDDLSLIRNYTEKKILIHLYRVLFKFKSNSKNYTNLTQSYFKLSQSVFLILIQAFFFFFFFIPRGSTIRSKYSQKSYQPYKIIHLFIHNISSHKYQKNIHNKSTNIKIVLQREIKIHIQSNFILSFTICPIN